MNQVKVSITRWVSDVQPGIVECLLVDRHGREWRFIEKVAIPYCDEDLDADSSYPQPGAIACEIIARGHDESGRDVLTIDTERPWAVWSVDDVSRFEVFEDQIVYIPFGWPHRYEGEC